MKRILRIKYIGALLLIIALSSCEQGKYDREIEPPVEVVSGEADFSNMVSLGASFVSGVSDGSLFIASQENSFPNIMAKQMELAGGGEFLQPLVNDNVGGLLLGGNVIAGPRLYFDGAGPVPVEGIPTTEVSNVIAGPFNNMGVPAAKSFHLVAPGYGNVAGVPLGQANPYFARMASSPDATVLGDAAVQNASFFIISEIAGNDVLGYATSGGTGVDQTGNLDPTTYGPNDITDPNVFAQVLTTVVSTMTANGAKGVIGNVPAVTSLPYFKAVSYNALNPNDPAQEDYKNQIPLLNGFYDFYLNPIFEVIAPDRQVYFSPDEASPMVIQDESLPNIAPLLKGALIAGGADEGLATILSTQFGQSRQAKSDDLLVLTSGGVIGTKNQTYFDYLTQVLQFPEALAEQLSVNGLTYPLEDRWVLLPSEQELVMNATEAYNQAISAVAAQSGLGFVNAKDLLEELSVSGISSDGFNLTGDYITGGAFSTDGIHLNARGYAFLANEFLKVIDETYGSNFEVAGALVDIGNYPAFYSPVLR